MNVLFLSELFYPHGGGAELATYLYAKLLAEAKFNVVVVTNRFTGESEFSRNEGFTVYRLPLLRKEESVKYGVLQRFDVLFSSFMRKWVKWADVVYVPRFWFSAIPVAKAMGKPVIVHFHDYIPICPLAVLYDSRVDRVCEKNGFCSVGCVYAYESSRHRGLVRAAGSTFLNLTVWPVLKRFIECSDAIICVSRAQRDLLVKHAPSLGNKVRVIYNPLPKLSPLPMDGNDFGYFGGPSYLKGFHVLLKALEYRKLRGLDSVTVHATKFSNIDTGFAGFLKGLGFSVYGKLAGDKYDEVYRKVKAVVVPSIWEEPLPYVIVEAMLRGRLVIASRVGGIPEAIRDCKGVFMLDTKDYGGLSECIDSASAVDRPNALDLGLQNRYHILEKFDNRRILNDTRNILERIKS